MRATTKLMFLGALALCLSACLPTPPDGDAAIFRRPSRYGFGSPGNPAGNPPPPKPENNRRGNRFGHNDGGNAAGEPTGPNPDTGPNSDTAPADPDPPADDGPGPDKKDMADSGGDTSSGPPSNLNSYPYARLVPGKKGFVTLPGADSAVGEIDVTGIKPGTPVEINDPRDPSKKIYFRVP